MQQSSEGQSWSSQLPKDEPNMSNQDQAPLPNYQQGYSAALPPQQQWGYQQPYSPQQQYGPLPPYQSPMQQQQQFAPPLQGQMAPYPPFMVPSVQVQNIIMIHAKPQGANFFLRALWFLFIGNWLGFFWLNVGYFLCFTIIGLPLGLMMLNRLPTVLTLRPASQQVHISTMGNVTTLHVGGATQYNFWYRALYFVLVGSWAGYLWANLGYFLCLSILGMPLGLMMLNRLPAVITLRRN